MIRGTTPTFEFTLPMLTDEIAAGYITFAQDGSEVIDKALADCTCAGSTVTLHLTQEETLKLSQNTRTELQMRVRTTGGEAAHTLTTSEMPSHNHAVYYPNAGAADHSAPGNYPDGPSDSTYYAIGSYTSSAGGDGAHNNMPPYLAVYVWKRTA